MILMLCTGEKKKLDIHFHLFKNLLPKNSFISTCKQTKNMNNKMMHKKRNLGKNDFLRGLIIKDN